MLCFSFYYIVSIAHSMQFAKSHLQASDFALLYHDSHLRYLTLLRNYHDQIRRSPIMQACWLSCAHYIIKGEPWHRQSPPFIIFFSYSSFILASLAAWSAAMQASIISSISPFMILSNLYRVRPIRWSVTRPCGKL